MSSFTSGYFDSMRVLLNSKVPSSLEKSTQPPTPVSASIYDLIMAPISYAASAKDRLFRLVYVVHFLCMQNIVYC